MTPSRRKNLTNPRIYVAGAIVVAIAVTKELRPEAVANALQIHVFTSLSPLLLPLLLRRIRDPKPSQKTLQVHAFTSLPPLLLLLLLRPEAVAHALQIHAFTSLSPLLLLLFLPRICDPKPSQNVSNARMYATAAVVVAIVVATQNPSQKRYSSKR